MKGLFRLLLLGGVALAVWLAWDWQRMRHAPLALSEPVLIELPRGTPYNALVNNWHQRGWLDAARDRYWLRAAARWNDDATRLQAGEYQLRPGDTPLAALQRIRRGEVYLRRFTVVEGDRFRDLHRRLQQAPRLKITTASMTPAEIMSALGYPDRHPEGRFLPETYAYAAGTTDLALLRRAAQAMEAALDEAWAQRDPDLPLDSPDEALVLASIIEKETAVPAERRIIAGVFSRRLQLGMRLQTDPTVIYGLGEGFDGNLRRRDLRADTPYNTYTRHGLPPTPIAMPGRESLLAAVSPAEGEALYFVSTGDGAHVFSATLEEHQRAVRRYQLR